MRRLNPRWNPVSGQDTTVVLRNATLFDGDSTLPGTVDICFEQGIVTSITASQLNSSPCPPKTHVIDLGGRFVTPGLVDIHSHHLELPFSSVAAARDVNEKPSLGTITPFVRAVDGFKPYDPAIKLIASGGVTSSLILPGSGNILGGQAYLVKNTPRPGRDQELVVEDLLFEHGIPQSGRRRYMKMACGENPKHQYGHTRLGNAWLLRQHLEEARKLRDQQDQWCQRAREGATPSFLHRFGYLGRPDWQGEYPKSLELEPTVALLRGEVNLNIHCYETEDMERMLAVLHEFDIHVQAFHHALGAWEIPEFLKQQEPNITIATFADNALFKHEAYGANLRAPRILDDHGIRVVLKSDHTGEGNYAKHLMWQASIAHSFGLSTDKSLQAVTSAGAHSINQDHRVGYVRPGHDADLVVWDIHPLQVGATPLQIYIDGVALLEADVLDSELGRPIRTAALLPPVQRPSMGKEERTRLIKKVTSPRGQIVIHGITKALLSWWKPSEDPNNAADADSEEAHQLTAVISAGKLTCIGRRLACAPHIRDNATYINLKDGHISPGLVAFGNKLGLIDIASEPSTGDGSPASSSSALNEQRDLHYAKYGVHFGGRSLGRARVGGVTRAITAPLRGNGGGLLQGVSVGLRTSDSATVLDGGIWKDEVALHVVVGQDGKGADTPTISSQFERLRQILRKGQSDDDGSDGAYARAARGVLPVVVSAVNQDDIAQVILLKREFPRVRLVIFGGHGAPAVAKELAAADIPVILSGNRGAPDTWEKKDVLPGPPLSRCPAEVLINAGVLVALSARSESKTHGLALEARYAAKFAGLSDDEAIRLVSTNFDEILGLPKQSADGEIHGGGKNKGDFVVWEGDPLRGEGSVVLTVQDDGRIGDCWPDYEGAVL
ncbi:amidohydrolase [Microdochium trichocladiopsis]|uniref:Amidohydrolase n=1 Tax=Microdochium trichocladiopsis TaxID=1682393 RepID=A0A9P8YAU9_9PEZI|nr:amidohydrolase [Microdochium trichocladiopsis]KAH7035108.1 amidohydrolase [Microdochium trichocladiopsis]